MSESVDRSPFRTLSSSDLLLRSHFQEFSLRVGGLLGCFGAAAYLCTQLDPASEFSLAKGELLSANLWNVFGGMSFALVASALLFQNGSRPQGWLLRHADYLLEGTVFTGLACTGVLVVDYLLAMHLVELSRFSLVWRYLVLLFLAPALISLNAFCFYAKKCITDPNISPVLKSRLWQLPWYQRATIALFLYCLEAPMFM
jgi:hypothetical protein